MGDNLINNIINAAVDDRRAQLAQQHFEPIRAARVGDRGPLYRFIGRGLRHAATNYISTRFAPYADSAVGRAIGGLLGHNAAVASAGALVDQLQPALQYARNKVFPPDTGGQAHKAPHRAPHMQIDMPISYVRPGYRFPPGRAYGPRVKRLYKKGRKSARLYPKTTTRMAYPTGLNKKFSDITVASTNLTNTATAVAGTYPGPASWDSFFKQIQQGSGPSDRIGRRIVCHSIEVEYELTCAEFSTTAGSTAAAKANYDQEAFDDYVHIAVVKDTQCNGTQNTIVNVWDTTSLSNQSEVRNMNNTLQYSVLQHKKIKMTLDTPVIVAASTTDQFVGRPAWVKRGRMFWRCAELVNYSASTGAIGDVGDNNVGIMAWAERRVTGTNTPIKIQGTVRVRFTDLQ